MKLWMAFIFFLTPLILSPSGVRANLTNFHFHEGPLQLNDEMFRRYGIPQLRSLMNEYFHLIRQLSPDASELISLREQVQRYHNDVQEWRTHCQLKGQVCPSQIRELTRQARSIDQLILRHLENNLKFSQAQNQDLVESLLWLESTLSQVSRLNYEVQHAFEQILSIGDTRLAAEAPRFFPDLHLQVHEMLALSEVSFTALLPHGLKDDFHSLWISVIKPIEQRIILPRDKDFYLSRLESLNTNWNSFNMRMTRGTSPLPRAQQNQMRIMHNRWNSVVRIILR